MRDMVHIVEASGLNAAIKLVGGVWYVEVWDHQARVGVAHGSNFTDVLSKAWTRQRAAARLAEEATP